MPNFYNPNFNSQVMMVYVEEPGFTGYKGFDFNKIDEIESILKESRIGGPYIGNNELAVINQNWSSLKSQKARKVTIFNDSSDTLEIKQIPVEGATPYVFNYNPITTSSATPSRGGFSTVLKTVSGESFYQNSNRINRALIYSKITEAFDKNSFTVSFKFRPTLLTESGSADGGTSASQGDALTFFIFNKWSSFPTPDTLAIGGYTNTPDDDGYRIVFDIINNNILLYHGSTPKSATAKGTLPYYGSFGGLNMGPIALNAPLASLKPNNINLKNDSWKTITITFNNGVINVALSDAAATGVNATLSFNDPFFFKRDLSGKYIGIATDLSYNKDSYWRIKDFELNGLDIIPINKDLITNLNSIPSLKLESNMAIDLNGLNNTNQIFIKKTNTGSANITYRWEV